MDINDWIRQRAGHGQAEPDAAPGPDLERAADLVERLGCTVSEAIELVSRVPAPGQQPVPPGNAGRGSPPPSLQTMDDIIRRKAGVPPRRIRFE